MMPRDHLPHRDADMLAHRHGDAEARPLEHRHAPPQRNGWRLRPAVSSGKASIPAAAQGGDQRNRPVQRPFGDAAAAGGAVDEETGDGAKSAGGTPAAS